MEIKLKALKTFWWIKYAFGFIFGVIGSLILFKKRKTEKDLVLDLENKIKTIEKKSEVLATEFEKKLTEIEKIPNKKERMRKLLELSK